MINKVKIDNFRNIDSKLFEFSDGITVFYGHNAAGKTNILEALYLLSSGKSFKAKVEEEMINYNKDISRMKAKFAGDSVLEIMLTRGLVDIGGGHLERVAKKKLLLNGVAKRLVDFAGNFKVVLFGPWDMDLVTESPSIRRKFLDMVLSQVDREYRRCILSYEKGLRQRNRLLLKIREEGLSRSQLLFWNQLLIKNGDYINKKRMEFIEFVNVEPSLNEQKLKLLYDSSVISEGRLEKYKEEEVAAGTTLVGPHRDDFVFFDGERNLASYGSRGEQRMGVLWLKISELDFIESQTGERPTLLLDDIFSELDHEHRRDVFELAKKQQTIITTADEHFIDAETKVEKISLK